MHYSSILFVGKSEPSTLEIIGTTLLATKITQNMTSSMVKFRSQNKQ